TLAAPVAIVTKLPVNVSDRLMSNPVSLVELSFHDRTIWLKVRENATKLVGGFGIGFGVAVGVGVGVAVGVGVGVGVGDGAAAKKAWTWAGVALLIPVTQ